MGTYRKIEDSKAWNTARELVRCVYAATGAPAMASAPVLVETMRREALRSTCKIAEGHGNGERNALASCLHEAKGAVSAVRSAVHIAADLGCLPADQVQSFCEQTDAVGAQIGGWLKKIRGGEQGAGRRGESQRDEQPSRQPTSPRGGPSPVFAPLAPFPIPTAPAGQRGA
ncbi:MAG: four helix bundle protein [Lentisphaeria bacterium]|nr:four helix bundle protein [Lentisphaeria bacterium]